METFMTYILLPLLLVPLSLYLLVFIRKEGSDDVKNLPPGSNGWPILGENVELALKGYRNFFKDRMEKYCPNVFRSSLWREKVAVFCGAQGNKFVLAHDNKLVTPWIPPSMKKVLFPDLKESSHEKPRALLHKFKYNVLKPEALKQYMPVMDSLAREQLQRGGWKPNSVVKVLPLMQKYTFELSCRVFLNLVDPDRLNGLSVPFVRMSNGFQSLPVDLPGTAFNRAIKAGKMVRGEMMRIVKERRKEMTMMENNEEREGGRDLLSQMLVLTDEDGKHVSDETVASFFVALLLASNESTAYAATAVMYFLAQLPHVYDEVFKEQMAIAKSKGPVDQLLTWEDVVGKMNYSWKVAREALRLAPPAAGGFREAAAELDYAGFTIPKGWKAYWTVYSSHMNPNYFPEPDKFDPRRFEGSGPEPYTFVPFGGGASICPGKDFAKVEILVLMHNVVTRFRLEKAIPDEKMLFHSRATPAHGLPVHLHPHPN